MGNASTSNGNGTKGNAVKQFLLKSCFTTVAFVIMALAALVYALSYQIGIVLDGKYLFAILSAMIILFVVDQIFKRFFWEQVVNKEIKRNTKKNNRYT